MNLDLFARSDEVQEYPITVISPSQFRLAELSYIHAGGAYFRPFDFEGHLYASSGSDYPSHAIHPVEADECEVYRLVELSSKGSWPESLDDRFVLNECRLVEDAKGAYNNVQIPFGGRWFLMVGPPRIFRCSQHPGGWNLR